MSTTSDLVEIHFVSSYKLAKFRKNVATYVMVYYDSFLLCETITEIHLKSVLGGQDWE